MKKRPHSMRYLSNCVNWPSSKTSELSRMIDDAQEVKFGTFLWWVDPTDLQTILRQLGYATRRGERGLRVGNDYSVTFWRGSLFGHTVYFMTQSAIEYVFAPFELRILFD